MGAKDVYNDKLECLFDNHFLGGNNSLGSYNRNGFAAQIVYLADNLMDLNINPLQLLIDGACLLKGRHMPTARPRSSAGRSAAISCSLAGTAWDYWNLSPTKRIEEYCLETEHCTQMYGKIPNKQIAFVFVIPSCNQKIATWYDAAACRRGVSFWKCGLCSRFQKL
jgi:hypothetical protein